MNKIEVIHFNDKNFSCLRKDNDFTQIQFKKERDGLEVNYFTGSTYGRWDGRWVRKFYPWHMIREIIYES